MIRTRDHRIISCRCALGVASLVAVLAACVAATDTDEATDETATDSVTTEVEPTTNAPPDCLVRIHGKGGAGADTTVSASDDGQASQIISPTGNADGWGGRQWLYFPDDRYDEARDIIDDATVGCERIVLDGFSNGAAFAGKLFCRGETFDARLRGVIVDDPVTDQGTTDCTPAPTVEVVLYWTGALADQAPIGVDCAEIDWTCDGATIVGIDEYARRLDVTITPSPFQDHAWYVDAPETTSWFTS